MKNLLTWNLYEITTRHTEIHGVMLRGRLRKLGLEHSINILCENASDIKNCVRFAILNVENERVFTDYLANIIPDSDVKLILENINNPVLSKLKVNEQNRYIL